MPRACLQAEGDDRTPFDHVRQRGAPRGLPGVLISSGHDSYGSFVLVCLTSGTGSSIVHVLEWHQIVVT